MVYSSSPVDGLFCGADYGVVGAIQLQALRHFYNVVVLEYLCECTGGCSEGLDAFRFFLNMSL